jgi:photosystem II stability/assembly factor-like uncharacterized protein
MSNWINSNVQNSKTQFTNYVTSYNGNIVYSTGNISDNKILYKSIDGGINWTSIFEVFFLDAVSIDKLVCDASGINVYFVLGPQVYRSNDSGVTIETSPLNSADIKDIKCSSNGQNVVIVTYSNGIFKSSDYGQTWINFYDIPGNGLPVQTIGWVFICMSDNASVLYIMNYPQYSQCVMYKSIDSGNTWNLLTTDLPSGLDIVYTHLQCSFLGDVVNATYNNTGVNTSYIIRSTNSGLNWTTMKTYLYINAISAINTDIYGNE